MTLRTSEIKEAITGRKLSITKITSNSKSVSDKLVQKALKNLPLTGGSKDSESNTLELCEMRLGDGVGDGGGLLAGQWSVEPSTGVVALTEATLARLINTDPIDKWYIIDPEPIAR